jgi:hypothetical protein
LTSTIPETTTRVATVIIIDGPPPYLRGFPRRARALLEICSLSAKERKLLIEVI